MNNNVEHPKHYQECSIECIEAMIIAYGKESVYEFCKCNAFKYLWRYKNKNGLEDIEKALWYCNKAQELQHDMYGMDEIERLKELIEIHKKQYIDSMRFEHE